jgi:hypothetical protein
VEDAHHIRPLGAALNAGTRRLLCKCRSHGFTVQVWLVPASVDVAS